MVVAMKPGGMADKSLSLRAIRLARADNSDGALKMYSSAFVSSKVSHMYSLKHSNGASKSGAM